MNWFHKRRASTQEVRERVGEPYGDCSSESAFAVRSRTDSFMVPTFGIASIVFYLYALAMATLPLYAGTVSQPPREVEITFSRMLEKAVIVQHAVFEKEVFAESIPEGARKQVFTLTFQGQDYVLGVLQSAEVEAPLAWYGSYDGVVWEANSKRLTLFDPRLNKNSSATSAQERITRLTANLFVNLGITELIKGSAAWNLEENGFVGQSSDGAQIVVDLVESNGVVAEAMIRSSRIGGEPVGYVRYAYDADFYRGQIPVSFERFAFGAPDEVSGRLFAVRIHELELTERQLLEASLNPRQLLREAAANNTVYYSNDTIYWVGAHTPGGGQKVLTAEEYQRSMAPMLQGDSGNKRRTAKFIVLLFLALSAGAGFWLMFEMKRKSTTTPNSTK